jgi:hypothetical protein
LNQLKCEADARFYGKMVQTQFKHLPPQGAAARVTEDARPKGAAAPQRLPPGKDG